MIETSVFADEVSPDFEEAVDLSVRAGARCLELRGGIWGRAVQNCTDEDVERMLEVLERYGARVAVIGSPVGKCTLGDDEEFNQHLRWFDRTCELARAFGTRIIRGFAFWTPGRQALPRPNLDELLPEISRRLSLIARRAQEEDVLFCLESEPSTCSGTCEEIARIIEALEPRDHVMVAWDPGNATQLGEHPLRQGYPLIHERIRHLHVKPNPCKNLETVGETDASWRQVFQTLLADGYEGVATVEHWGSRWLMLEGVRQTAELLGELQSTSQ